MIKQKKASLPARQGITLLMSVYISSAAILLGLGVYLLLFGELGLSGTAKGSILAFYAADTGIECGLYYDLVQKTVLATTTYGSSPASFSINCNGGSQTGTFTRIGSSNNGGNFIFSFSASADSCVKVTVQKLESGQTIIDSFGQNLSDCAIVSQKASQRGLEVIY